MMKEQDLIKPLKKLAKMSTAKLGGVACFVLKNGAIVSSGINYNPTGGPMEEIVDGKLVTRPEVIHAEVAALQAAKQNGVDLRGTTMLLTTSPCIRCAAVLAKSDVDEVIYMYEWWDKASFDVLRGAGKKIEKMKEERP